MRYLNLTTLGSSLVLIFGMSAYGSAHAHGDEHDEAAPPSAAEANPADAAAQNIPPTAAGIWHAIDQQEAELGQVVQSGALGEVHRHAFAIRDLAAGLPSHGKELPRKDRSWVAVYVKYMPKLAERLDESADAKDLSGTRANFEKMKDNVEKMRAHFWGLKGS